MVTARSEITLPGSWRGRRLHIGASASDRASVKPERSAISASRRLPAWVARPLPSAVIFNAGRHLVAFTWYVPSCLGFWRLDNPIFPGQEGFFADLQPLHLTANEGCGLVLTHVVRHAKDVRRLARRDLRRVTREAVPGATVRQAIVLTGLAAGLALALSLVGHVHTHLNSPLTPPALTRGKR